jgi:RNA polymerase sigma-70 factor (ECF subfamily)
MRLPKSEPELVAMAARCSSQAFAALMERYRPLLRSVAKRHLPDRESREDLCQDVVERLLDHRKQALRDWQPLAPFGAYLSVIASRLAWRKWQKARRELPVAQLALPAPYEDLPDEWLAVAGTASPVADPAQNATSAELREAVYAALAELSPRDRTLLNLRFFAGLQVKSLAPLIGLTPGAAAKAIFDALRRLERKLEAAGHTPSPSD